MDDDDMLRNADFLSVAMEQMDPDSVEFEFVEDVYQNLLEEADK